MSDEYKTLAVVSGGFDPVHVGHLELFNKARQVADELHVIVNNDNQRRIKGSKEFMLEEERALIIDELALTDKIFISIDQDRSVSLTIEKIHSLYSAEYDLFFVNGGDQNNHEIPEADICNKLGVKLIDGLGDKIQSSSWLLNKK